MRTLMQLYFRSLRAIVESERARIKKEPIYMYTWIHNYICNYSELVCVPSTSERARTKQEKKYTYKKYLQKYLLINNFFFNTSKYG